MWRDIRRILATHSQGELLAELAAGLILAALLIVALWVTP